METLTIIQLSCDIKFQKLEVLTSIWFYRAGYTGFMPSSRHSFVFFWFFNPCHTGRYSIYLPQRDGRL